MRGGEYFLSLHPCRHSSQIHCRLCTTRQPMLLASAKEAVPKRRLHGYVTLAGAAECEAASGIKNMESAPRVFNRPNQNWAFPVSDLEQISLTGSFTFLLGFPFYNLEDRRATPLGVSAGGSVGVYRSWRSSASIRCGNLCKYSAIGRAKQFSASGSPAPARCCSPRPALSLLPALCFRHPSTGCSPES